MFHIRQALKDLTILSISTLLLQIGGGLYRIYIVRRIGAEVIGLMGMVFPLYRLLIAGVTLGLPTVLARFVASDYACGNWQGIVENKKTSLIIVTLLAALLATGVFLFSSPVGNLLYRDRRTQRVLNFIAPVLLLTSVSMLYRGYFRGLARTLPLALSESGELLTESAFVLWAIRGATKITPEKGLNVVMTGFLLGEFVSLFTLVFFDRITGAPEKDLRKVSSPGSTRIRRRLLQTSLPLLAQQLIHSVSDLADGILIPKLLIRSGLTPEQATHAAGEFWGVSMPVAFFPLVFLTPLSTIILPATARAATRKTLSPFLKKIRFLLLAAVIYGSCAAALLWQFGGDISRLLYKSALSRGQLAVLITVLPFAVINALLAPVAEGLGKQNFLCRSSLALVAVKAGISAALIPIPGYGMTGAAWGLIFSQALFTFWLFWELRSTPLLSAARPIPQEPFSRSCRPYEKAEIHAGK